MKCGRCAGVLVSENFMDILDETGEIQCEGWRCINCGDITDHLIQYHRQFGVAVSIDRTRRRRVPRLKVAV